MEKLVSKYIKNSKIEKECKRFLKNGYRNYTTENSLINGFALAVKLYKVKSEKVDKVLIKHLFFETPISQLPFPLNDYEYYEKVIAASHKYTYTLSSLNLFISNSIIKIREKYSLKNYKKLIDLDISLINNNDLIFSLSPILMNFDVWKQIIKYEISLTPKKNRKYEIVKMIHNLKDLELRLGSNYIFNFDNLDLFKNDEIFPEIYLGESRDVKLEVSIDVFINYLEKIDPMSIKETIKKDLIEAIKKLEVDKEKKEKIQIDQKYNLRELLHFFENSGINSQFINFNRFLIDSTNVSYTSNEHNKESQFDKLTDIEFEDFLLVIKYLISKNIFEKNFSKIGRVINRFSKERKNIQHIRKKISYSDESILASEIQRKLNGYLKEN